MLVRYLLLKLKEDAPITLRNLVTLIWFAVAS